MSPGLELAVRNTDRVLTLASGQTIVAGRTVQCDLQLDDPSVSRRHCSLTFDNGVLQIKDLESANGTFVNERQVRDARARPGDLIRLGAAVIEVRDPAGMAQRPEQTIMVDDSTVESVMTQ